MQTSKNHFEAAMIFNDETIRLMFRTEYFTYEKMQLLTRTAMGAGLVLLALFAGLATVFKVPCLMLGCWLFISQDFPSRVQAEGVLQQRGGQESRVTCRINDSGIHVENGTRMAFAEVDRLVYDDRYYYIFKDRQTAVMLPKNALLPNSPERFEKFLAGQTGKSWQRCTGLMNMNLKELRQMMRDRAGRWQRTKLR